MKRLALLVPFVCVAASPPASAGPGLAGADPAPAPAPPPIYPSLRDPAGPVPGLAGYKLAQVKDASRCGGIRVVISHGHAKPAAEDRPFADVLAFEFPSGLDFTDAHKDGSVKQFQTWLASFNQTARTATYHYTDQLKSSDPRTQLAAYARIVQIRFRMASVLARAEIPKMFRTDPSSKSEADAYCDELGQVAAPLLHYAEQAQQSCADKAAQLGVHGWWDQVCPPNPSAKAQPRSP